MEQKVSDKMKSAVLFVSHVVNDDVVARYRRLRKELPADRYDVVWLMTLSEGAEPVCPNDVQMVSVRPHDLRALGYTPIASTIVPGSCHFLPLRFFLGHQAYRHYWLIEYDVEFTGNWLTLLHDCDTHLQNYDLLACHVERFGIDNHDWTWWHRDNHCGYPTDDCIKAFLPICRYSHSALAILDRYLKAGQAAHSEVMVPTCLHHHDLKIGDIGGNSPFAPNGYRDKYYIQGPGVNNGTMRWRPAFTKEETLNSGLENTLFHPVKAKPSSSDCKWTMEYGS